jgi:hypothetical protein
MFSGNTKSEGVMMEVLDKIFHNYNIGTMRLINKAAWKWFLISIEIAGEV